MPLHNVEESITELARVVAKGARALTFPHDPEACGLPGWYEPYWDPLLSAIEDNGIAMFIHIATPARAASPVQWNRNLL